MPQRHRTELSDSVSGERLVTYRRTPRTFSAGRTCAVLGCPTVLSIYNSAKNCAAHQDYRFRVQRPGDSHSTLVVASPAPVVSAVA